MDLSVIKPLVRMPEGFLYAAGSDLRNQEAEAIPVIEKETIVDMNRLAANKYNVICPVCCRHLFSSSSADIEDICCPKCKRQYTVTVTACCLQIREIRIHAAAAE